MVVHGETQNATLTSDQIEHIHLQVIEDNKQG